MSVLCGQCGLLDSADNVEVGRNVDASDLPALLQGQGSPMSDLVVFLRAALDEDERIAREALASDQMHPFGDTSLPPLRSDQVPDAMRDYLGGRWGDHAARWDMNRVLADIAAKRAIVERYAYLREYGDEGNMRWVLCTLAQVYSHRPGFDPAWAV